jgi:hypothetical protein
MSSQGSGAAMGGGHGPSAQSSERIFIQLLELARESEVEDFFDAPGGDPTHGTPPSPGPTDAAGPTRGPERGPPPPPRQRSWHQFLR